MEDVRLGRASQARSYAATVTTTSKLVVTYDPNRIALVFTPDGTGTIQLALDQTAVDGAALVLNASTSWQSLNIQEHGHAVFGPWYAIVHSGTANLGVIETTLPKQ